MSGKLNPTVVCDVMKFVRPLTADWELKINQLTFLFKLVNLYALETPTNPSKLQKGQKPLASQIRMTSSQCPINQQYAQCLMGETRSGRQAIKGSARTARDFMKSQTEPAGSSAPRSAHAHKPGKLVPSEAYILRPSLFSRHQPP